MVQVPTVQPRLPGQDVRLLQAARAGNSSDVACLLRAGSQVDASDANGHTALMLGAMAGQLAVVRLLIEAGADTSLKDDLGYDAYTAAMFFGDFRGSTKPPFDEIMSLLRPRS